MSIRNSARNQIDRWIRTPLFLNGVCFLLGTLFGLIVLGWTLWPVQYVDTTPAMLRADLQLDYLRMAVDSYSVNGDATLARSRFEALGARKLELLEQLQNDGLTDPERLRQFQVLIASLYASEEGVPAESAPAAPGGGLTDALSVIAVLGIVIGGAIALVLAVNIRRNRLPPAEPRAAAETPEDLSLEAEEELAESRSAPPPAGAEAVGEAETGGEGNDPLERFVTTYAIGDELYEDSFTINSPGGDFLGECGVGISESVGVGEPKKVTALEVWLFDRKPSRTSTTVLMSQYAHDKADVRAALAPRGTPALATPGADFWMETPGLQLRVVIRELIYGSGPLPANSYFERLTLQLEVWAK